MDKRRFAQFAAIAALALSSLTCSLFTPKTPTSLPAGESTRAQGTIDALQGTIDAMQQGAAATANAWMTEAAPSTAEPGGTALPQQPTQLEGTGTILGKLSFPSESIPPIRVVAFNIDTGEYFTAEITSGGTYAMDVPAGQYQVVAYLLNNANSALTGGYSQAVPCGLSVNCTDHSLITFEVKPGEKVQSIDPGDWYAPPGSFPPDPTVK